MKDSLEINGDDLRLLLIYEQNMRTKQQMCWLISFITGNKWYILDLDIFFSMTFIWENV